MLLQVHSPAENNRWARRRIHFAICILHFTWWNRPPSDHRVNPSPETVRRVGRKPRFDARAARAATATCAAAAACVCVFIGHRTELACQALHGAQGGPPTGHPGLSALRQCDEIMGVVNCARRVSQMNRAFHRGKPGGGESFAAVMC